MTNSPPDRISALEERVAALEAKVFPTLDLGQPIDESAPPWMLAVAQPGKTEAAIAAAQEWWERAHD